MLLEALLVSVLVGAGVVALAPNRYAGKLAAVLSLVPLGGSLYLWSAFDGAEQCPAR